MKIISTGLLAMSCFASVAMLTATVASDASAAEYYEGKTITVLVPNAAGGGLDLIIRTFAKHWGKHIPGNPTVIAKNMPGGGGAKSLNFLYDKARPDGLTVGWGSWNAAGIVTKAPGLRFVPEKFGFVGAASIPQLTMVRTDLNPPITKATDITNVSSFNVGGRRADRSIDLAGNMAMTIMGVNFRYVGGYRGMAKIKPALLKNEVQGTNMGYVGYHVFFKDTLVKSNEALPLWYHSDFDPNGNPVGTKGIEGMKPFHEVYKDRYGKLPSGAVWEAYKWYRTNIGAVAQTAFVAPGTPKEAIMALQKGYYATANDPAYTEPEKKRIGIGLIFQPPEVGEKALRDYRKVSPAVLAALSKLSKLGSQ